MLHRVSNCSLARVMDGRIMRCGIAVITIAIWGNALRLGTVRRDAGAAPFSGSKLQQI